MSDTTSPPPTEPTVTIIAEPNDCPFPDERLTMRFGFSGIPLTEDETARCLKARRSLGGGIVARLQIACAATPKPLTEGLRPAYRIRARHHVELSYAGHRIHIEAIAQDLAGPGGSNDEIQVFVDGILEGRSIKLGRLGATVNTFPLVARVNAATAMTINGSTPYSRAHSSVNLGAVWFTLAIRI